MDMYPYAETFKVGAAYAVLLYIWPCILFRRVLRDKGLTFRFLFCSIVQPVLISTVVLALGLFHILNVWIVRGLFWGVLAVSLLRPCLKRSRQGGLSARLPLQALLTGSYGWKMFFFRIVDALVQWRKKGWQQYRKRSVEYLTLACILLFGMAFFLNGAFHEWSFGCQDQYTHYEWTSALLKGEIFSAGIYPEGMHCFLYALHVLFGVELYSCVLFLAGIHNSTTFLLAAYCLFKELFRSRHTPLFVLTAWLVFDGIGSAALESMSRMTWTLPQEFALYLVFLCPLLLLRYFREQDKPEKWYRDENLLLLMVGVAFMTSTHFYVLIMAFISCCTMSLVHYGQVWPIKRLLPPVSAALYGIELGGLPMLAAYAMGTDLEGSRLWRIKALFGVNGEADTGSYFVQSNPLKALYENGYLQLFGRAGAALLILLSLLVLMSVAVSAYERRQGKIREAVPPVEIVDGYIFLIAGLTAFVLLYAMPCMGLPELVPIDRIPAVIQMLAMAAVGILVELLILWIGHLQGEEPRRRWMALGCLVIYLAAYAINFHQCTFWWLRRFNAAVSVTDQIIDHYPEGSYKIVSMQDETYQVGEESHEDLDTFLENTGGKDYSIPVEYIFLYVEKLPLLQGQVHFLTAPRWLARENYEAYAGLWSRSQCPDLLYWGNSESLTPNYPDLQDKYNDQSMRMALFSEAYSWYQEFSTVHPAETNIYYEDHEFICYMIHQDQSSPLKLATGRSAGR